MREAINQDDIVSIRLRSVLAVTDHGTGDQRPYAPTARPPRSVASGTPSPDSLTDFTDTTPLTWSDILPSWPHDLDLRPDDHPVGPVASTDLESGSLVLEALARASAPPDFGVAAERLAAAPAAPSPAAGSIAGLSAVVPPCAVPEPPPAAELPPAAPEESAVQPDDPMPSWARGPFDDTIAEPLPALGATGAFDSGPRGRLDREAAGRGRLISFDPGRRGAKALIAVAVVVVLIAAVVAWHTRPRVDQVAVPPIDAPTASAGLSGGTAGVPTAGAASSAGAEMVVAVGGKVRKPGLVRLPPGSRVADALHAAGGADPGTDVALLNLARKLVDGELILVGVTPPPGAVARGPAGAPAGGAGTAAGGPVNLNTATLADLDGLPGVGPVLAQRILDARDAQGGFKTVSDLRKVNGIGDSRYEQLKDLVVV